MTRTKEPVEPYESEPRWPAVIAAIAVGGLYTALPDALTLGPNWLLPSVVLGLLIPNVVYHHAGRHRLTAIFGFGVNAVLTAGLIISVILLVNALPTRKETPQQLLLSSASLWVTNILVFALWYWRLDAGGPYQRDKQPGHSNGSFLFPQMTSPELAPPDWEPGFVDYLYVSFTNATAFSPTDVMPMTRWAKLTMLSQSAISVVTVALVIARAVNILK